VVSPDALLVTSFMAAYAAVFIVLLWLIGELIRWALTNGLFWYVATPVATLIWMAHLST
jgi:hypothetical protein